MEDDNEKLVALSVSGRWRLIFSKSFFVVIVAILGALVALTTIDGWTAKLFDGVRGAACDANTSTLEEYRRCRDRGRIELNQFEPGSGFLFGTAYAQTTTPVTNAPLSQNASQNVQRREYIKDLIVGGTFGGIFIFFFWCIFAVSFSKSSRVVSFALDSMKVLSGFFIGTVTGFISP